MNVKAGRIRPRQRSIIDSEQFRIRPIVISERYVAFDGKRT